MEKLSTSIYNSLSSDKKPAYFQLLHHRILATHIINNLWITAGANNLRASQARISTNDLADQVEDLFEQDYDLELQYHHMLNGM